MATSIGSIKAYSSQGFEWWTNPPPQPPQATGNALDNLLDVQGFKLEGNPITLKPRATGTNGRDAKMKMVVAALPFSMSCVLLFQRSMPHLGF